MNFTIKNTYTIDVCAPLSRQGKPASYQATVTIIEAEGDVQCPIILTSDLHNNTDLVLNHLEEVLPKAKDWTFISAGDMAGDGKKGGDGDAIPHLQWAKGLFRRVYFVQGNHDFNSPHAQKMKNSDGTLCHLSRRRQNIAELGWIAGMDGIISSKKKLHRTPKKEYFREIQNLAKKGLQWLVTHEVPCIPSISKQKKGYAQLTEIVTNSNIQCHVFGHCYFSEWYGKIKSSSFFGVDGRVILLKPRE
ncbi:metallophosphoesterase family protein [Candidatus Uabimicrobium amorphum]|uniref:Calcineurin-like phosphoesterase domain-containing protein n=1 Tax=Uabimicrobium amorphum TaxID=2596890 RepID=A0A5S9IRP8_UABAM|nr:metallophosphoesterase family protein [Candidatus Uabimicrobium amorphum]BBM86869.1 hypothetical protein UABAM_05269 [Candidatus Uabimicrobium amorphum]